MFDFKALAEMKENIQKKEEKVLANNVVEPKEVVETISEVEATTVEVTTNKVTVVDEVDTSKMTMDQKIDLWISQCKDEPKIVFNDTDVLCLYDDKTETVTITDRASGKEISFVGKDFFEYVVFESNSRPEKGQKIKDKFKEITGTPIGRVIVEVESSDVTEEVEVIEDTVVESTTEEEMIVIPEI